MTYDQLVESDMPSVATETPAQLFAKAHKAGMDAGQAVNPTPMVVQGGGKSYFVGEGVCGFASIVIKPARGKFVKWLKENKRAYKHYYGGIAIFVGEFGQSLARKEAYASAFVQVLKDSGINAYVDSRMD